MKKDSPTKRERWNARQARVVLDSLCVDVEPDEGFENGDVRLVSDEHCCLMQCLKCGASWEVDSINLKSGLLRVQAFVPWGLGYRFFFQCPNECNRAYIWREDFQWVSVMKDVD
jgi:hypothetical protein